MSSPKYRTSRRCHCAAAARPDHAIGKARNLPGARRGIRFLYAFATALCLAVPGTAAAEPLGRLFLTPQQREDLDRRRATNRVEEEAPTPQIKEGPLTLDGQVQRSDGRTTTWINGVPEYDSHRSRDPARLTLVPNEGESGVSLKVGQVYERASGEVRDRLNGGVIKVERSGPKAQAAAKRGAAGKSPAPAR